ncbi:hypothetical protein [Wolbachia endosymbiont of Cantharis cryptica]|uniref:hypothetical protein n=1 Tax=Wolbachia endosymbiont of Cantharis cryptica TaxID=3066132 RepID=UPI00376EB41B
MKGARNLHDCANDGTCGQSIQNFKIGDADISFYDDYGRMIAQIPKLPYGNSITYNNNLYKTAKPKDFGDEYATHIGIRDVLPNQFNFEYEKLNVIVHYDNVSQREQEQIKLDIQNAYEAYKAKFCINSDTQVTVDTYIFNNGDDYRQYGTLVPGFLRNQNMINSSAGVTDGKSVLLYKNAYMDNVLSHEFGHVFQFTGLSTAKVKELDRIHSQLMANAIGLEIEEKNHKVILEQKEKTHKAIYEQKGVDEYEEYYLWFELKYKGTTCYVNHRNFYSTKEKDQIIQDVKSSYESLISECDGLGDDMTS